MKTKRSTKTMFSLVVMAVLLLTLTLSGCGVVNNLISKLKGELTGNDYVIQQFDNFGNLVLTAEGDKITMNCEIDENGDPTSYINIIIDGSEWQHVGSTLVFAQNGVSMITDFQLPETIGSNGGSSGLMAIDRYINNYQNMMGKKLIVLVSSQNGTPIGLFQGDSCYMEVPADLPKTTRLNIDGKAVYVHRANVDIIPATLLSGD